jgi:hypothetical protein
MTIDIHPSKGGVPAPYRSGNALTYGIGSTRRMEFASLIEQQTILKHIDREIARLEDKLRDRGQLSNCINSGKLAQKSSEVLANLSQLLNETDLLRIDW